MSNRCHELGGYLTSDVLLREHFPYVRQSEHGEFIIPAERIGEFVQKYMELMNNEAHMEQLRLYRESSRRKDRDASGD